MKAILMNKNTKVLELEYQDKFKRIVKVNKIINIDYAPLILKDCYESGTNELKFLLMLDKWLQERSIPSWRDKLETLLNRLGVDYISDFLDKAYFLSLSDQYWLKSIDLDITYDDVNFFTNDFAYESFADASLLRVCKRITNEDALKTPNNTTEGMLRKAWIIEDGVRYLLKASYKNDILQPFNEVLASMICESLGFEHVLYTLDTYKDIVVSKCPCFITPDTELITAYQILNNKNRYDSVKDYEEYIECLERKGIKDARIKVENMFILDFLIMNEDRHLNNFGIIRDVNTLKWLDVAPIFDSGLALNISYYTDDEVTVSGEGRFFYERKPFDEIIKIVKNIKRIDVSKLDGIVEEFDNLLHKYQDFTYMSDRRIHLLCVLLNRQINKLKALIEEAK